MAYLEEFLREAEDIRRNGRGKALGERLIALFADPGPADIDWVHLMTALYSEISSEYAGLRDAYQKQDVPLLAWRARNLLELSVWAVYCSKSRENARRVIADAARDMEEVFDKLIEANNKGLNDATTAFQLRKKKQELRQAHAKKNAGQSLDGHYMAVRAAAEDSGFGDHFPLAFKVLSKFAHPTAMRIMLQQNRHRERNEAMARENFYAEGSAYFVGAFRALEEQTGSESS